MSIPIKLISEDNFCLCRPFSHIRAFFVRRRYTFKTDLTNFKSVPDRLHKNATHTGIVGLALADRRHLQF